MGGKSPTRLCVGDEFYDVLENMGSQPSTGHYVKRVRWGTGVRVAVATSLPRPLEILDTGRRASAQPAEAGSISVLVGRCSPVRASDFRPIFQDTSSARSPSAVGCRISLNTAVL